MLRLIGRKIDAFSKNRLVGNSLYIASIAFFFLFVLFPAVFVLVESGGIRFEPQVLSSLATSFEIAIIATAISLAFGIPLAWMISRSKGARRQLLDTLVDMPLIIPTSALGFSVYLFWGSQYGLDVLEKGFWLIVALHTTFIFPYVVRTVSAAFDELDKAYETAAHSLGANPLTCFRTISFPLVKSAIIIGAMLAFTRSLSETGATMMVSGLASTAPVAVLTYKNAGDMQGAISTSIILIAAAVAFLFAAKYLARKMPFTVEGISPRLELRLSRLGALKDAATLGFFLLIILVPAFFFFVFLIGMNGLPPQSELQKIYDSLAVSFLVAAAVTAINLFFGFSMAMLIGRNKWGLGKFFETANEIVLVVPTSALGLSLGLYWAGVRLPEIAIIALAHLSFTFPYIVTPIAAAVSQLDRNMEEAAATLGASPYKTLSTVVLPLIIPSVLAGLVMAFMRSISETGATLAVSKNISTVPVLIVNFVNAEKFPEAAIACLILFAISFVLLVIMRRGVKHA